jgi:hypothetical protein
MLKLFVTVAEILDIAHFLRLRGPTTFLRLDLLSSSRYQHQRQMVRELRLDFANDLNKSLSPLSPFRVNNEANTTSETLWVFLA